MSKNDQCLMPEDEGNSGLINYYMLPAKVAYFIDNCRISINEFLILYYTSVGFNQFHAGRIIGFQILGGVIATPFWSVIADSKRKHKLIASTVCILAILTTCLQPVFSAIFGYKNRRSCHDGIMESFNATQSYVKLHPASGDLLTALYGCSIVASVFDGSITSFVDSGVLKRINTSPVLVEYGHQAYMISIGYSVGSILYSISIKYYPGNYLSCETGIFIAYFLFTLCLTFSVYWLFDGILADGDRRTCRKESDVTQLVRDSICKPKTFFFLLNAFFFGLFKGTWYTFVFLYLREMSAPILLLGMSITTSSFSSMIVMLFVRQLTDVLKGPMSAISLSFCAWAIRFIWLVYTTNPYMILLNDLLHGFSFALFNGASLEYIRLTYDPVILTSICGVFNAAKTMGMVLANCVGGLVYWMYGGTMLYELVVPVALLWSFIVFLYAVCNYRDKRYTFVEGSTDEDDDGNDGDGDGIDGIDKHKRRSPK